MFKGRLCLHDVLG